MTAFVYNLPDYANAPICLGAIVVVGIIVVVMGACFALHKWVHHA